MLSLIRNETCFKSGIKRRMARIMIETRLLAIALSIIVTIRKRDSSDLRQTKNVSANVVSLSNDALPFVPEDKPQKTWNSKFVFYFFR